MKITEKIERRSGLSVSDFHSLVHAQEKPLIIESALDSWVALKKWDPPYLSQLLADAQVKYKYSARGLHPDFYEQELKDMFAVRESTFADYITRITTGPEEERARYLFTGDEQFLYRIREGKAELNETLAPLWDDVSIPEYVPQEMLYSVWSWFSAGGVKTWLHYDNNDCHNLNAQVRGSKRCLLFAPEQIAKLAMFPAGGPNPAHNCSQIDIFAPDVERFPEFAEAEAMEAQIEQGDLFFIPANWSHAFEHQGTFNVNVNFWYRPGS